MIHTIILIAAYLGGLLLVARLCGTNGRRVGE